MSSPWAKDTYVGSRNPTRATIMNRGPIALWTRTRPSIGRLRASAPSSHGRFSVDCTTNIAESDFRYTQANAEETFADIDLIPIWLEGKFNTSTTAFALTEGTLRRFLNSDSSEDWQKACRIVGHCTALRWVDDELHEENKATTAIQDFWIKEVVKGTAAKLGEKIGKEAALLLAERVQAGVFARGLSKVHVVLIGLSVNRDGAECGAFDLHGLILCVILLGIGPGGWPAPGSVDSRLS